MTKQNQKGEVLLFEDRDIRRHWDEKLEKWFFSVVDIIGALTDSSNPRDYWFKMKIRVKTEEDSELSTKCRQLKMLSRDGKRYLTDCSDIEGIFRIIQSVPSPKVEPIKLWLARVGHERIQEISDPERAVNRGREYWQKLGRSEKWIQQRMFGQETRNKLTDYWQDHEVTQKQEFAILTNLIHQEWTGITVKKHKEIKNLKFQNLRDHMSDAELIFTALAELSTKQIAESMVATGLEENKTPAVKGGRIARNARLELEEKTGKSVVTPQNFLNDKQNKKLNSRNDLLPVSAFGLHTGFHFRHANMAVTSSPKSFCPCLAI